MRPFYVPPHGTEQPIEHNRLVDVYNLETGETVFLMAQCQRDFSERVRFGPRTGTPALQNPANWIAQNIEEIAYLSHDYSPVRPILIPVPIAAFMDENLVTACHAAILRTPLCPQEVCLEIDDATVTLMGPSLNPTLEALKRHGFRLSLNATLTATAALSENLRLLLDTLRLDARRFEKEADMQDRVEAARAAGIALIAENAFWRDGPYLARHGIDYGINPRRDG